MSDHPNDLTKTESRRSPVPSETATSAQILPSHGRHSWIVAAIVAAIMVLLALGGVGLTTNNSTYALTYWIYLVPVYGLLCMASAWSHSRQNPQFQRVGVIRQLLHWLGIGAALGLDFMIRRSGEETAAAAGFNAMLLLAVGCFLAGVHVEWLFAVVGVLLTAALIVVVKAQEYVWLIFVVGVVVIVALLAFSWLLAKARAAQRHSISR